jgi:NADH-ubiquinone oxidoreductase chain 5
MKNILFISGALTITIARLGALYEIDLKKIIALSTLRQLGLIIIALRINLYLLAFFHLLTHALFKSSLFLAAGRIIHLYRGRQDVRGLRMITSCIPITRALLIICSLALGGAPFLSAFYSKDKIIEVALRGRVNFLCIFLLFFSVLLTIMYRFRLIYYITIEGFSINYEHNIDRGLIVKPIRILSFGGIVGGRAIR